MASKTFRCRLVTPTASLLDEQISYASIPAWDGLFGVLPGRAPILARLGSGELRVEFADSAKGAGGSRSFFVDGGFVRMLGEELTVIAERAQAAETLTVADAEREFNDAMQKQPGSGADKQAESQRLRAERERARVKLHIAKSRKGI